VQELEEYRVDVRALAREVKIRDEGGEGQCERKTGSV
jgi:hypothetical protein